jgi:NAD(P)-dependent dehydrogenase (short-subunit alcohol dehydrogenase family)
MVLPCKNRPICSTVGFKKQFERKFLNKIPLKTALVTGAAKRIGRAIAMDLAANGFAVAIHANDSLAEAEALAGQICEGGGQAVAIAADLTRWDEAAELMGRVVPEIGPVGLVVNNASIFQNDSVTNFDQASFDAHFAIHVRAPSLIVQAFARHLPIENSGLVVNLIDQRVWSPNPRFYSYTLSKAALWMATQTMAQALAPDIRVNAIGPGPTLPNDRQEPKDFQAQLDGLLLKDGPKLEDFGRTIRFLFDTPSITGQMIALDGGQHLGWETPDVAEIAE